MLLHSGSSAAVQAAPQDACPQQLEARNRVAVAVVVRCCGANQHASHANDANSDSVDKIQTLDRAASRAGYGPQYQQNFIRGRRVYSVAQTPQGCQRGKKYASIGETPETEIFSAHSHNGTRDNARV